MVISRSSAAMGRKVLQSVALGTVAFCVLTSCAFASAPSSDHSSTGQTRSSTQKVSGDVFVFAAASLTDVLEKLEAAFESYISGTSTSPGTATSPGASSSPGTATTTSRVKFISNVAGSQSLVQQVNGGTMPDVLITADEASIAAIEDQAAFENKGIIAKNTLVLVVPHDSSLNSIEDFMAHLSSGQEPRVARCASDVPCGRATQTFVDAQKLSLTNVSEEADVRSVLSKVSSGEVDAGFVYATDAKSAGENVKTLQLQDAPTNTYSLLVRKDASEAGRAFATWLTGKDARAIFQDAGFGTP
ncbi:molybdate ABC transporter substrate-binding protein [Neomicrococcus lactis]|uniref:molybdate ABC transporter substrate-binding protein n=1 Tax=Neomicrococcus lactis TaxID=732241 RepID=UPI002301F56E|nr:molybdate ABC transporter substrate-binding protein [Neomicrococcus lactis]